MCALLFVDSFDHYSVVAGMLQKWHYINNSTLSGLAARTGIQGLRVSGGGNYGPVRNVGVISTWIVGFAYQVNAIVAHSIVITRDLSTTTVGTDQGTLKLEAGGQLGVYRGAVQVAVSTKILTAGVWNYIEFKHTVAPAGGLLEARVNGEVWVTFTGNTRSTANSYATSIRLIEPSASTKSLDDLYVLDGTGPAPNNDYWGDTAIHCLLPNGVGAHTELATLVGAASHWQATNEVPPNDDTSYVADNVVGRRDTYQFDNLPLTASGPIHGIQVLVRSREDVAGGVSLARMYRNAGVDNQGADVNINTGYHNWIREILAADPIIGGEFTIDRINSAEFGFRVRP